MSNGQAVVHYSRQRLNGDGVYVLRRFAQVRVQKTKSSVQLRRSVGYAPLAILRWCTLNDLINRPTQWRIQGGTGRWPPHLLT